MFTFFKKYFTKEEYYCDGICEICELGKQYEDKKSRKYYTCDKRKTKRLKIIPPTPPGEYERSIKQ